MRCAGNDDLCLALAEFATPSGSEFTDDEKKSADLRFDLARVARLYGGDWLHVLATMRLGENELHGAYRDRSFLASDEL